MDYPELVNKSHIDKNEWTTIYTYTVKKADVTLDVYDLICYDSTITGYPYIKKEDRDKAAFIYGEDKLHWNGKNWLIDLMPCQLYKPQ